MATTCGPRQEFGRPEDTKLFQDSEADKEATIMYPVDCGGENTLTATETGLGGVLAGTARLTRVQGNHSCWSPWSPTSLPL